MSVPNDARRSAVRRVLWWVLAANLVVIAAKIAIGVRSGSIAVLGDAAHSGVDALNNLVALFAVRLAAEPPDEEHPYGHGKFETLGALAVVSFLSITCFELITGAVGRLLASFPPPSIEPVTFWVLAGTMVVNVGVARAEASTGRRLGSELLLADARHTAADVLVTLSVLFGLVLIVVGWPEADAWLAILVALVIARSGLQILRSTVPVLVDSRALDAERIRSLATETPGVMDATEIRSRGRPGEAFAELTIRVDPGSDLAEAHRIADTVERKLARAAGFSKVVVHVEPVADGDSVADHAD
ncbi:MAG: cation diffusion facilitator family transporter [Gemmatimonadota bacterium]